MTIANRSICIDIIAVKCGKSPTRYFCSVLFLSLLFSHLKVCLCLHNYLHWRVMSRPRKFAVKESIYNIFRVQPSIVCVTLVCYFRYRRKIKFCLVDNSRDKFDRGKGSPSKEAAENRCSN
jgi:hypothetical protein